jgi:pantoate--beta-alanine ligase
MRLVHTIGAMREACAEARARKEKQPATVGLVATMGALHEGHISLVREARRRCDVVVATIFVNPTQFGEGEDFTEYPRSLTDDCGMLEMAGVHVVFAPSAKEMYPEGEAQTIVRVGGISSRLDGASRPGHFRGVATVVAKLFHIVEPDVAFFGQKDAAQVAVLKAMVRDLDFGLEMVVCPTVRESDGLAMSSRNRYLTAEERERARVIPRVLEDVRRRASEGVCDATVLRREMVETLSAAPGVRMDYAEIVDAETLLPVGCVGDGALMAVAAWVGETRLIDNIVLEPRATLEPGAALEARAERGAR